MVTLLASRGEAFHLRDCHFPRGFASASVIRARGMDAVIAVRGIGLVAGRLSCVFLCGPFDSPRNGARNAAKIDASVVSALLKSHYKLLVLLIISMADSVFW